MNSLLVTTCYEDVKLKLKDPNQDPNDCKNFSAVCIFCKPKIRRVAGNVTSTTNFLNHVKVKLRYYILVDFLEYWFSWNSILIIYACGLCVVARQLGKEVGDPLN